MNNPFDLDEDEWVEICDASGKRAAMRHLGTLSVSGKTYFVLGSVSQEEDRPEGLLLVREDETMDGVQEYVVADDESEIEDVVGRFVAHTLMKIMENAMDEAQEDDGDEMCPCGMRHAPGEFCVCDEADLLQ